LAWTNQFEQSYGDGWIGVCSHLQGPTNSSNPTGTVGSASVPTGHLQGLGTSQAPSHRLLTSAAAVPTLRRAPSGEGNAPQAAGNPNSTRRAPWPRRPPPEPPPSLESPTPKGRDDRRPPIILAPPSILPRAIQPFQYPSTPLGSNPKRHRLTRRRSTCVRRCLDKTEPEVRVCPPLQTGVKGSHRLGKSVSLDKPSKTTNGRGLRPCAAVVGQGRLLLDL
jgi:hypothetical protein